MLDAAKDDMALTRSELRSLQFKQRISDAAIGLFAQLGVNETSVSAIIQEAGIAHKTFFNHFPTKQHLLSHIACEYTEALFNVEDHKEMTPFECIHQAFMRGVQSIESLDENLQNMISYILISTPTGPEDLLNKQTRKLTEGLSYQLKKAEGQKRLQPGFSADIYTDIVGGILMNIIIRWAGQHNYPMSDKMSLALAFIQRSVFIDSSSE